MTDLGNATRHFTLIRSKDAGPFMLTLDLFFVDAATRHAFVSAGVFTADRIGDLYGVDPAQVQNFELADIPARERDLILGGNARRLYHFGS